MIHLLKSVNLILFVTPVILELLQTYTTMFDRFFVGVIGFDPCLLGLEFFSLSKLSDGNRIVFKNWNQVLFASCSPTLGVQFQFSMDIIYIHMHICIYCISIYIYIYHIETMNFAAYILTDGQSQEPQLQPQPRKTYRQSAEDLITFSSQAWRAAKYSHVWAIAGCSPSKLWNKPDDFQLRHNFSMSYDFLMFFRCFSLHCSCDSCVSCGFPHGISNVLHSSKLLGRFKCCRARVCRVGSGTCTSGRLGCSGQITMSTCHPGFFGFDGLLSMESQSVLIVHNAVNFTPISGLFFPENLCRKQWLLGKIDETSMVFKCFELPLSRQETPNSVGGGKMIRDQWL